MYCAIGMDGQAQGTRARAWILVEKVVSHFACLRACARAPTAPKHAAANGGRDCRPAPARPAGCLCWLLRRRALRGRVRAA
jgi:hypothetical protein